MNRTPQAQSPSSSPPTRYAREVFRGLDVLTSIRTVATSERNKPYVTEASSAPLLTVSVNSYTCAAGAPSPAEKFRCFRPFVIPLHWLVVCPFRPLHVGS